MNKAKNVLDDKPWNFRAEIKRSCQKKVDKVKLQLLIKTGNPFTQAETIEYIIENFNIKQI